MIAPIDAADWLFVNTLAALKVDELILSSVGNRAAAQAALEEYRLTTQRLSPGFKARATGLVDTAEVIARAHVAGGEQPPFDRFLAQRTADAIAEEPIEAPTPSKRRRARKESTK